MGTVFIEILNAVLMFGAGLAVGLVLTALRH